MKGKTQQCQCNAEAIRSEATARKCIVQMFEHLKTRKDLIFSGFESAGITKAIEKCNEIRNHEEKQFTASYSIISRLGSIHLVRMQSFPKT